MTKTAEDYRSKCCDAPVRLAGDTPDFIGNRTEPQVSTMYFECSYCGKPCDVRAASQ